MRLISRYGGWTYGTCSYRWPNSFFNFFFQGKGAQLIGSYVGFGTSAESDTWRVVFSFLLLTVRIRGAPARDHAVNNNRTIVCLRSVKQGGGRRRGILRDYVGVISSGISIEQ